MDKWEEKRREGVVLKCLSCVLLSYPQISKSICRGLCCIQLYYYRLIIIML